MNVTDSDSKEKQLRFKIDVLCEEIESEPDMLVGDCFMPIAYEILPGGYEYRAFRRLTDKSIFKVRIEHLGKFEEHVVHGDTKAELEEQILDICDQVRRKGRLLP